MVEEITSSSYTDSSRITFMLQLECTRLYALAGCSLAADRQNVVQYLSSIGRPVVR